MFTSKVEKKNNYLIRLYDDTQIKTNSNFIKNYYLFIGSNE